MAKKRAKRSVRRATPIQTVCNAGPIGAIAGSATADYYINAAHILSMMNRKAFHQVTRSGHLKNYGLRIQVFNMVNASTTIRTASTSYATYNAARAWHFARKERLSDAGFSLGDLGYGARLRFALDKTMSDTNQSTSAVMISPSHLGNTVAEKGEWDWSDVIITPPVNYTEADDRVNPIDLSDSFVLHLCGDHTAEDTGEETLKYTHVGIIQSWTENRRGWAEPDAEEVIQPENPLAFARASDLSSYALTTEVSDEQKQSPPYSNEDDDDAESVFAELVTQGQLETAFPNPTTNTDMVIAPGGVAKVSITNNTGDPSAPMLAVEIIELD